MVTRSELKMFGYSNRLASCSAYQIDDAVFIETIEVTYNKYITSLMITTTTDSFKSWGRKQRSDFEYKWTYTPER